MRRSRRERIENRREGNEGTEDDEGTTGFDYESNEVEAALPDKGLSGSKS